MDKPEEIRGSQKPSSMLQSLNVAALGVGVGRGTAAALQKLREEGGTPTEEQIQKLGAEHGYAVIKEFDLE